MTTIYQLTDRFPTREMYGLTAQMRRSAISVPSNVAEGFRRGHWREFRQFLNVALGSLAELETQLLIARELQYVNEVELPAILESIDHISRMITKLGRTLGDRTHNAVRTTQHEPVMT